MKICHAKVCTERWLSQILHYANAFIILFICTFAITESQPPGIIGLLISVALQCCYQFNDLVQVVSDLETDMIAIERIDEYSKETREADWFVEEYTLPKKWPHSGQIKFTNYTVKYKNNFDPALENLNVVIKAGEKVGICGRTGAGKFILAHIQYKINKLLKSGYFLTS